MNFLAHLFLSGDDIHLMIGNFIGDSVKGHRYDSFPDGIRKGILLHRAIDHYSDNHPVFLQSVERLRPRYRKYAGVIVDMYYDHFLARYWHEFSEMPLNEFADRVQKLMLKNSFLLPEKSLMFLKYATRTNRLISYATFEGMGEAFYGMSRRTTFRSNMEFAVEDLKLHYDDFENEFRKFFAEATIFVKDWIEKNKV